MADSILGLTRRVEKLEGQDSPKSEVILFAVERIGGPQPALSPEQCVAILRDAGHLRGNGFRVLRGEDFPMDFNATTRRIPEVSGAHTFSQVP